jgi:hypothetical protein
VAVRVVHIAGTKKQALLVYPAFNIDKMILVKMPIVRGPYEVKRRRAPAILEKRVEVVIPKRVGLKQRRKIWNQSVGSIKVHTGGIHVTLLALDCRHTHIRPHIILIARSRPFRRHQRGVKTAEPEFGLGQQSPLDKRIR